jgi:hypothetical protein
VDWATVDDRSDLLFNDIKFLDYHILVFVWKIVGYSRYSLFTVQWTQ